nr:hypothetical protein MACL_00001631 [Theileria orientalis]
MYYCLLLASSLLSYFAYVKNSTFLWRIDDYLISSQSREYTSSPDIGFVLAHPDDESMFFLPTLNVLKTLTDSSDRFKPQLHFLYLSNGDYYNDGSVRESELAQLCEKHRYSCSVVDDSNLRDGTAQWDPEAALEYIRNFVSENNISVLFTFDAKGVSGHPNHVGTHHAVKFIDARPRRQPRGPVDEIHAHPCLYNSVLLHRHVSLGWLPKASRASSCSTCSLSTCFANIPASFPFFSCSSEGNSYSLIDHAQTLRRFIFTSGCFREYAHSQVAAAAPRALLESLLVVQLH